MKCNSVFEGFGRSVFLSWLLRMFNTKERISNSEFRISAERLCVGAGNERILSTILLWIASPGGGVQLLSIIFPILFFVPYTSNPSVSTEKIILKGLSGVQQPLSSHQKMGSLEFLWLSHAIVFIKLCFMKCPLGLTAPPVTHWDPSLTPFQGWIVLLCAFGLETSWCSTWLTFFLFFFKTIKPFWRDSGLH